MIIGFTGFAFKPGVSNPASGTILSTACTYADGYDYNNNYWSGDWNYSVTRADGAGGSYTNVEGSNSNGCYIPYGFVYYSNSLPSSFDWSHGSNSGHFEYGYSYDYSQSDGAGGTYSDSGNSITAADGTVVNSYGYTDGASGYPMTSYLKFLASDTSHLHEFNFIDYGTNIGSYCSATDTQDASGATWVNVNFQIPVIADGNGGSYYGANQYNTYDCGYLPYGFWDSYFSYGLSFSYTGMDNVGYTFQYGNTYEGYMQDSFGGSFLQSGTNISYSNGYVFNAFYDEFSGYFTYYAFDGNNGYYTYTSNP